jgi:hypothetical protein
MRVKDAGRETMETWEESVTIFVAFMRIVSRANPVPDKEGLV